ncbi:L-aspartate oxidase [Nitratidesulfovibrio sp. SRB-5]|uniref:L-aspartate oxidase n=1 Tax=Nitratidesulfovibrio sp. SRB-5 TaxID=2872636 RepID=UPI0010269E04|nr:FAD-binding protein [Nitratidesulfovibrio sp. SRB-5]MBZ2172963.1 FAD-binding protein [Nitratidesulfovibrio sp. SRB-5]RXF78501.1 FAD-binding protein [Desulfovibrio sp. DS-1]
MMQTHKVDLLILGMGAAAELAAIYAHDASPSLNILIASKALKGKGGCSRMVQGGFNVVLSPDDSHEKHLMDTLKGGQYINNQDLAKQLVEEGTPTVKELETVCGCFFDRFPDGRVHQKPFAGQSFDRTVHRGDLTGIEIISRTTEQVFKRRIPVLEETRAVELLLDSTGKTVTGALLYDMRRCEFLVVEAAATLVATGGGPTQYRFHAPGPEKSADGIAMLYRAGARMRDMEMIQFHPTGLIVPGSVVAGALLEEGLRGAGAHLYNGEGERYMQRYAPDVAERATRDVVSRSAYMEMMAGRACPEGGVHIDAAHMGADFVLKAFPGMAERCAQFGYDLARGRVPVSPTAHFFMGGAEIDTDCRASLNKLFVAGEDAGGVHGANRLGGNGIAESCVYGRLAGKSLARFLATDRSITKTAPGLVKSLVARLQEPLLRTGGRSPLEIRHDIQETNWLKVGIIRNKKDMEEAIPIFRSLGDDVERASVSESNACNMIYNVWLDTRSMIDVSIMAATSALLRDETRGAHTRLDFPEQRDDYGLFNTFLWRGEDGMPVTEKKPVEFTHKSLEACQKWKK